MLPPDYTEAVRADYHNKKAAGKLPFDMKQLSPARFKAACLEVRRGGYDRRDERLLKAFFGEADDEKACLRAIADCNIDKFRPLIYFLKEKTTTRTDDKNVELLAWMINFKNRPCEPGKKYPIDTKALSTLQGTPINDTNEVHLEEPGESEEASEPTPPEVKEIKRKWRKIIFTLTIVVAFGMIGVWIGVKNASKTVVSGHEACMYWAEDHYQPVSCSQKIENVQVIALDSEKVVHFRRITRPDTITVNARGSVWYVRYRGTYEFYTSDGFHPLDPTLRLRPITEYIIGRHVPANP